MTPTADLAAFAAVFAALFAAHSVGDHWIQTHHQACAKGAPTTAGRLACLRHVATLTATKAAALAALAAATGLAFSLLPLAFGLAADALSHYWADRRTTLAALAERIGKGDFYRLGSPRPGYDDAVHLGTGAYALDQSFHHLFLFAAALIITA
ncbi:DUF3307 domain-containing protein [Planomonospora sp. ID82291]|uniref:DUF3307 domain-containing protein n=1 Tax=Planomonospora sp. ID82291 TaxID=2738136 RepID=UPI0018C3B493|nr:DUF3307 domain-containing protein [Planomonospora sp. ID82291]MBG0814167.1 DUF3307 domain-containing protein [Planomonospora sp. ID82291]